MAATPFSTAGGPNDLEVARAPTFGYTCADTATARRTRRVGAAPSEERWPRTAEGQMTTLQIPRLSAPQQAELERTFFELANRWRDETALLSSVTRMAMHPAYQRIIGMACTFSALPLRTDSQAAAPTATAFAPSTTPGEGSRSSSRHCWKWRM